MSDESKPRIELYAFSHLDPIRRRWVKARYRATLAAIEARYGIFRIEGSPEMQEERRVQREQWRTLT